MCEHVAADVWVAHAEENRDEEQVVGDGGDVSLLHQVEP